MARNTFTLFLIEENVKDEEEIFTSTAIDRINASDVVISENFEFAEGAIVYIFPNPPKQPKWFTQIKSFFEIDDIITNRSSSALLRFWTSGRLFVVTFGYAWLFLNPKSIVQDFGLRVALNAADDSKLKRLDIANLGQAMRGVTQSASERQFETFGVDEALELVRKISGTIRNEEFGSSISGSSSLKVNREMEFYEIPELANEALNYFLSENYKDGAFQVIDNIFPQSDVTVIDALNKIAADSIAKGKQELEIGLPDFSQDDFASFRFTGFHKNNSYSDLQLFHYREMLGERKNQLIVENLFNHKVRAKFVDSDKPDRTLTIHELLVGSVEMNGKRYAINEGKWYSIDDIFKRNVDEYFSGLVFSFDKKPPTIITKISPDGKTRFFENEDEFNARYAKEFGYVLMDKKFIHIPDIARSRFELCDLLDIEARRLIHVKMSGRRSSVLSHFFKQGANSARLLKTVDAVWNKTVEIVRNAYGDERARLLESAICNQSEPWVVEFHIADAPVIDGQFQIPFFSRVTFREEATLIRSMGFEVRVRFIRKPSVSL